MSALTTFLASATSAIGKPYVFGATGPSSFDCSGLVQYALNLAGIKNVPRLAHEQEAWTTPVSNPQPGDLAFWGYGSNAHVAIYIGGGKVISAPQAGENVKIENVWKGSASQPGPRYGRVPGLGAATSAITGSIGDAAQGALSGITNSWVGPVLDGAKGIMMPLAFAGIGIGVIGLGMWLIATQQGKESLDKVKEAIE
jgi:hypothetical protein